MPLFGWKVPCSSPSTFFFSTFLSLFDGDSFRSFASIGAPIAKWIFYCKYAWTMQGSAALFSQSHPFPFFSPFVGTWATTDCRRWREVVFQTYKISAKCKLPEPKTISEALFQALYSLTWAQLFRFSRTQETKPQRAGDHTWLRTVLFQHHHAYFVSRSLLSPSSDSLEEESIFPQTCHLVRDKMPLTGIESFIFFFWRLFLPPLCIFKT